MAGFRAWNKLGRVVRKGEPGLPIFAPVTVRKRAETNNNDDDDSEGKRTFFRVVYVWDVGQTKPLPGVQPAPLAPPARQPLTGDSHAGLLQPLTGLAEQLGYRVHYRAWKDRTASPLQRPQHLDRAAAGTERPGGHAGARARARAAAQRPRRLPTRGSKSWWSSR